MHGDVLSQIHDLAGQFALSDPVEIAPQLAGAVQFAPGNPQRVAIIFYTSAGGACVVVPKTPNPTSLGIEITSSLGLVIIKFSDCPALVQAPWFIQPSGAGGSMVWQEVIALP